MRGPGAVRGQRRGQANPAPARGCGNRGAARGRGNRGAAPAHVRGNRGAAQPVDVVIVVI